MQVSERQVSSGTAIAGRKPMRLLIGAKGLAQLPLAMVGETQVEMVDGTLWTEVDRVLQVLELAGRMRGAEPSAEPRLRQGPGHRLRRTSGAHDLKPRPDSRVVAPAPKGLKPAGSIRGGEPLRSLSRSLQRWLVCLSV